MNVIHFTKVKPRRDAGKLRMRVFCAIFFAQACAILACAKHSHCVVPAQFLRDFFRAGLRKIFCAEIQACATWALAQCGLSAGVSARLSA